METEERLIREIQKGILKWYDFKPSVKTLYIGTPEDALAEELTDAGMDVVCVDADQTCQEEWREKHEKCFGYIISVADLEMQYQPENVLKYWNTLLTVDGRMLLGMNNRLGLRYFCGDRDPYTERNFDSVENYRRAYVKQEDGFKGRMYSQAELKQLLRAAGWESFHFFSVISDLKNPAMIYSEDFLPNESLSNRVFPTYNYPSSVFLEEESMYDALIENGMFHQMANAYLIECSPRGEFSDMQQVTCSLERGKEDALLTIIRKTGTVEKRAVYPEGQKRLEQLVEHGQQLRKHGLEVVEARLERGVLVMPYVKAETGQAYLKRLLLSDKEQFLQKMDLFRDLILKSSEIIESDQEDGNGAVLRRAYLDMVPLNSFYRKGKFIFYDQEFCKANYPANVIIYRMIGSFYAGNMEFQKIVGIEELFERYGLKSRLERWQRMEGEFLSNLLKKKELQKYHENCRRSDEAVYSNRQRMNYSAQEYQRLFEEIFQNADTRKLILFGSGTFAKTFLALYRYDYPVYAIVDNNKSRWGDKLDEIEIQSPEILKKFMPGEYKVLICIKNYVSVMKQLDAMGVTCYSIFDKNKAYPRKRKPTIENNDTLIRMNQNAAKKKKYHIGYIAGVFDLFHVGHLNLFKRAKEQCDYLIAGVVTDEGVKKNKRVEPFIPFEERIEMVRSCRYVDEAVEIPLDFCGTRDAYRIHHFDVQFSGSDYRNNPEWLADKEFLEKNGVEMVFFPYTEGTSSTKIKGLIEKRMM